MPNPFLEYDPTAPPPESSPHSGFPFIDEVLRHARAFANTVGPQTKPAECSILAAKTEAAIKEAKRLEEQVETLLANEKDWSDQARRHCEQIAGLKEQLQAALDSTMHQENYDAACMRADEAEARLEALQVAAKDALDVLHDPAQTWLPAAEILSVALAGSNPASRQAA